MIRFTLPVRLPAFAIGALIAVAPALVLAGDAVRLSEPVASDAASETFGEPLPADADAQPLAALMQDADRWVGEPVVISARIGQVCQKKGCFFIARDGHAVVRVTFKDYGFFIPTDSGGKRATFSGVIERQTVSEEQAEHFAEDLGSGDAPVAAGPTYTIVASSIRIPR